MNVQSVISNLRCAKNPLAAPGRSSETILRAELDLPRRGTDIRDLPKIAVGYVVVRITITRDVEHVEEICAKSTCRYPGVRSLPTDAEPNVSGAAAP